MGVDDVMDLKQMAIEQLKLAEQMSLRYYQKPVMVTYSGGKDSDVCVELAKRAGIQFEVVHSHTTADAPQTVYHVRKKFKALEAEGIPCQIVYPTYKGQHTSMWDLIPQMFIPPTRIARYCCQVLKETCGRNRLIVTGVRAAESTQRADRGEMESAGRNKNDRIILNNDNDTRRRFTEHCEMQGKIVCNPILNWQDRAVWDFLHEAKVEVNPLYECGFHRVGCIGCPMARKTRYDEFRMFPAYERIYRNAFGRMLKARKKENKPTIWKTANDVFRWWMEDENLDGQLDIFGGEVGKEDES